MEYFSIKLENGVMSFGSGPEAPAAATVYKNEADWLTAIDDYRASPPELRPLEEIDTAKREAVNAERDRRIAAGFTFAEKEYDFDISSKANISGAAQLAFMAVVAGAQQGNLRWNGGSTDFAWIAKDNSLTTMDAQTVIAFGQTAATHEQKHIFAARAIKEMSPIPDDYADEKYWP